MTQPRSKSADSVIVSIMERIDNGEQVDRAEVVARHPEIADELQSFFEMEDVVGGMAGVKPNTPEPGATAAFDPQPHPAGMQSTGSWGATPSMIAGSSSNGGGRGRSDDELASGETFGRYRIAKTLGQGGMGAVYLAEDTLMEREVALKLPKFSSDDPEVVERFYTEARTAGNLRHANICPVYDVGEIDGRSFITMAYIPGHPLSYYARSRRRQPVRQIAKVVRKLALALHVAHEAGVVHRDIKPDNVMIDSDGEPIVMDFGLARQTTADIRLTQMPSLMGTPLYMSPEQVDCLPDVGPSSDQFSVAGVLYEMLTGRPPFPGQTQMQLFDAIRHDEPIPPSAVRPEVDADLDAICLRMLAKAPGDRFDSMKEVADALMDWLRGDKSPSEVRQTTAGKPSLPPPSVGDVSRRTVRNGASAAETVAPSPRPEPADPGVGAITIVVDEPPSMSSLVSPRSGWGGIPSSWAWLAGGLGGAAILAFAVVFLVRTSDGGSTLRIEIDDPEIEVSVKGTKIVVTGAESKEIELEPGEHTFHVKRGDFEFDTESLVLKKGETTVVSVTLVHDEIRVSSGGTSLVSEPEVEVTGTPEDVGRQQRVFDAERDLKTRLSATKWEWNDKKMSASARWFVLHADGTVKAGWHKQDGFWAVTSPTTISVVIMVSNRKPVPVVVDLDGGRLLDARDKSVVGTAFDSKSIPSSAPLVEGKWRWEGDELVQIDAKSGRLEFGDHGWTDYDIEVDARSEGGSIQLLSRVVSRSQWTATFLASFDRGKDDDLQVESQDPKGGQRYDIRNRRVQSVRRSDWHTIRVRVRGDRHQARIDDGPEHACLARHVAGRVGLRVYRGSGRFRNLKVTSPDGKILFDTSDLKRVLQAHPDVASVPATNATTKPDPVAGPVPLAAYEFDGNGDSSSGEKAQLENTEFRNGTLFLNGIYERSHDPNAYKAIMPTPRMNYRKFSVVFRVEPETFDRPNGFLLSGGPMWRWMQLYPVGGRLHLLLSGQDEDLTDTRPNWHRIPTNATIVPGRWNTIGVAMDLDERRCRVYANGSVGLDFALPRGFETWIVVGHTKEVAEKTWTFTNYGSATTLKGGRGLSPSLRLGSHGR